MFEHGIDGNAPAVLRLPLHCGVALTEAAGLGWPTPGSLTTAPPLRPACPAIASDSGLHLRAVLRLPLHCGFSTSRYPPVRTGSGQSYDCPSIAAGRPRSKPDPTTRSGQSYDCPSIAARPGSWQPISKRSAPGSLTTAPPLRQRLRGHAVCRRVPPGSLTTAPPLRLEWNDNVRVAQGYAPGSLTTAPPLRRSPRPSHRPCERHSGQSYDCPSIAAVPTMWQ